MNILLTGGSGQLGQELLGSLGSIGRVTSVDRIPGGPGSIEADLGDLKEVENLLRRVNPDVIINTAAHTAVDQAENEVHKSFHLNAELPACLARWCQRSGRFLLHYSTDYVFDGESRQAYTEDDAPGPLGVYGQSKLAGEWALGASGCWHVIVRTSWVYSTHGSNFVLSMLRLARQRSELTIVNDQRGCPTWARNLASASVSLLKRAVGPGGVESTRGVFHFCDATPVTWYEFARMIFDLSAELELLDEIPRLKAVNSSDFPQVARRPHNSVLDTRKIREAFAIQTADLPTSLRACLMELV